jgi:ApaG protein
MHRPFYYRETQGIRVTVRPAFLPDQSRPSRGHFVFAYAIRLENIGRKAAQLRSRYWRIHDSVGENSEVEGDGVVGEQPIIRPGRVYEYQSFCVLKSPSGFMEGRYRFVDEDRKAFDVLIPRFALEAESADTRPE